MLIKTVESAKELTFLDEYVDKNNPARAIDSYVDSIDLAALGVFASIGSSDGQPASSCSTFED